jgi:hypothetical protein
MSQPVKLSDELVLEARVAGEALERSIAGQVEFWAKLGRSVDLLLDGRQVLALRGNGRARPLSEALASVDTRAGRKRIADVLARRPFPHYEQNSGQPGVLLRIDEDGTRTAGRFVNRLFVAASVAAGGPERLDAVAKPRTAKKLLNSKSDSARANRKSTPRSKERAEWA